MVASKAHNLEVGGSNPSPATRKYYILAQSSLERYTDKVEVIGSNPIYIVNSALVQLVRILVCHTSGRGFKSHTHCDV